MISLSVYTVLAGFVIDGGTDKVIRILHVEIRRNGAACRDIDLAI